MSNLKKEIERCNTSEELEVVIRSFGEATRQENGFLTSKVRHLENAFWYDLSVEERKVFLLRLCGHYCI